MNALGAEEFDRLERRTAPQATADQIELAHPASYRRMVADRAPSETLVQLDADTVMGPSSLEAALRGAGAACAATDAVFNGEAGNAFVAARPPGHHAEPDRAMGFCIFNNAAIAALRARHHGARRVAVLDFDVHHGNGTEVKFWHDCDAFYGSTHEWPQYPGTGRQSDGGAFDNIVNAPLQTGTDGDAFRRAWGERILPRLAAFNPEFIVISAGFDAHRDDPLGGLLLKEADFDWITREIAAIARDKAAGRLISVLEGGYHLEALGRSAAAHVKALMEA